MFVLMRVIVTGNRNWYAPDLAEQVVSRLLVRYGPGLVIVHGGATGIDRSFAEVCDDLGVEQEAHPARWEELDVPGAGIPTYLISSDAAEPRRLVAEDERLR